MDEEDIKSKFNEAITSINYDPASETNSQLSTCLFASFGKKTRGYPSRNEKETTFLSSVYDFFIKPCEDILAFILADDLYEAPYITILATLWGKEARLLLHPDIQIFQYDGKKHFCW